MGTAKISDKAKKDTLTGNSYAHYHICKCTQSCYEHGFKDIIIINYMKYVFLCLNETSWLESDSLLSHSLLFHS